MNSQIKSFMAVVKYSSFSKAAMHLYVSQSAISKNIALLEKKLGYILLDRSGNSVNPTAVGKMFYDFYQDQETRYQQLLDRADLMVRNQGGDIRLGILNGWDMSQIYPRLKKSFKENYPDISLSFSGYDYPSILEALSDNKIDMAVMLDIFSPNNDIYITRVLTEVPVVLIVSASHPLAGKADLCLPDFKDEPFYVVSSSDERENPMGQLTVDFCRKAGFTPQLKYAPSFVSIFMELQSSYGVWITSGWVSTGHSSLYRTIDLGSSLNICAIWIDDEKRALKHILVNELAKE